MVLKRLQNIYYINAAKKYGYIPVLYKWSGKRDRSTIPVPYCYTVVLEKARASIDYFLSFLENKRGAYTIEKARRRLNLVGYFNITF